MDLSPSYQYCIALNVYCNITYFSVPFAVLQMMPHWINEKYTFIC